jgi:hypothetical protein
MKLAVLGRSGDRKKEEYNRNKISIKAISKDSFNSWKLKYSRGAITGLPCFMEN